MAVQVPTNKVDPSRLMSVIVSVTHTHGSVICTSVQQESASAEGEAPTLRRCG